MRLLIVEDDPVQGEPLALQLKARGHEAEYVPTATGAELLLPVHAYDALVVDKYVPGRDDGMDLLRKLRADPATRELPVVLITAAAAAEADLLAREAAALGRAVLVRKPFEVRQILAALESLTDRPA